MTDSAAAEPFVSEPHEDEPQPASRYDDMAEGYARFWAPVIRPGAIRVLDLVAPDLEPAGTSAILDVGSGTGSLAIATLKRWPWHRVTGIDPSGGMLEVARDTADQELPEAVARRFRAEVASADRLPFDDATFDVAVSSFVLQLVKSRSAALREVRRVLKPGGVFAWVAWLRTDRAFEPDRIANELLDEAGFDPPEPDRRPGDLASVSSAAQGMRRAGYVDVRAHAGEVEHAWDADGYRAFYTEFDEASLFDDLEPGERDEIRAKLLERLGALRPEQLTLRLPVVYIVGRAPS
ncbi:MAG: methyltransferase domain-containing protein [Candidatus Limnocylindrales bacterium]